MYTYNPAMHSTPRRTNPIGAGAAVGLIAGLSLVGITTYALTKAVEAKEPQPLGPSPTPAPGEHELSGVYVPGATLAASAMLKKFLQLPIVISTYSLTDGDGGNAPTLAQYPNMTRAEYLAIRSKDGDFVPLEYIGAAPDGDFTLKVDDIALLRAGIGYDVIPAVTYGDGTPEGARQQILRLLTDLATPVIDTAFDAAMALISEGYSFDEPSTSRDAYVAGVLKDVAPQIPWPGGSEALSPGTPRWRTWMGVDLVGQIAYQIRMGTQIVV